MARSARSDTGQQGDGQDTLGKAREETSAAAGRSRQAAGEVAGTVGDQARQVTGQVQQQARGVSEDVRGRLDAQAQAQTERAAQGLRRWADDLASMADNAGPDSSVAAVVRQVADGSRRAASTLEENGAAGLVQQVESFARRRPGAFLTTAVLAGFAVGRLGRAAKSARPAPGGSGGPSAAGSRGGPTGRGR